MKITYKKPNLCLSDATVNYLLAIYWLVQEFNLVLFVEINTSDYCMEENIIQFDLHGTNSIPYETDSIPHDINSMD